MLPPPRLFTAPARRRTTFSLVARQGGSLRLAVHVGDEVDSGDRWESYEELAPGEALDVITAVVADEWGLEGD